MKKILSLVLVFVLCMTTSALAAAVPSKTTEDLTKAKVEAVAENGMGVSIIVFDAPYADAELRKLQAAPSLNDYFGKIAKLDGTTATLTELMGTDAVDIFEFAGLRVERYNESYGAVKAKMQFSTPYEKDEKVSVLVGLQDGGVAWTAFDGTVIDDEGTIEVTFTPDMLMKVQNGTGLIAIASEANK